MDLKTLAEDLKCVGAFIRIAYNAAGAAGYMFTETKIKIQRLGQDIAKLCNQSALTVNSFLRASSTILSDLQATYGYLLDGKEKIAVEMLSSVLKLAGDMEKEAFALHEKFDIQAQQVVTTMESVQITKGNKEEYIEQQRREEAKLEANRKHQQEMMMEAKKIRA